jgi:hypothetical protein
MNVFEKGQFVFFWGQEGDFFLIPSIRMMGSRGTRENGSSDLFFYITFNWLLTVASLEYGMPSGYAGFRHERLR